MSTNAGLYIDTLNNTAPICVNAHDPRVAHRAIGVAREHCKFGKAGNLDARRRNYEKTFGCENLNFFPIVETLDAAAGERAVLQRLSIYRIRGSTGRRNEWLAKIRPLALERLLMEVLESCGCRYEQIGSVVPHRHI